MIQWNVTNESLQLNQRCLIVQSSDMTRALHSTEICVLSHYLLKQKEILDAVHRYAVCIQQAVELET